MNNKIGFWTFMSIIINAVLIYALYTDIHEIIILRDQKAELNIQINRLYSDSIHSANEIKHLNELIEFHKELNGVQ